MKIDFDKFDYLLECIDFRQDFLVGSDNGIAHVFSGGAVPLFFHRSLHKLFA